MPVLLHLPPPAIHVQRLQSYALSASKSASGLTTRCDSRPSSIDGTSQLAGSRSAAVQISVQVQPVTHHHLVRWIHDSLKNAAAAAINQLLGFWAMHLTPIIVVPIHVGPSMSLKWTRSRIKV